MNAKYSIAIRSRFVSRNETTWLLIGHLDVDGFAGSASILVRLLRIDKSSVFSVRFHDRATVVRVCMRWHSCCILAASAYFIYRKYTYSPARHCHALNCQAGVDCRSYIPVLYAKWRVNDDLLRRGSGDPRRIWQHISRPFSWDNHKSFSSNWSLPATSAVLSNWWRAHFRAKWLLLDLEQKVIFKDAYERTSTMTTQNEVRYCIQYS